MQTFRFYSDDKYTVWERTHFEIEANSQEEANEIAIKAIQNRDISEIYNTEMLYETMDKIPIEENNNCPTLELHTEEGVLITDNTINNGDYY